MIETPALLSGGRVYESLEVRLPQQEVVRSMNVAIHQRTGEPPHSSSWSLPWATYCAANHISHEMVDCLAPGTFERLREFDILLWHFSNYDFIDMSHARSILFALKEKGLLVFPDYPDAWHFDDKIAQSYLLKTLGAPIPSWWVFFSRREFDEWLDTPAQFPIVAKLKAGSGSHNVKLLRGKAWGKVLCQAHVRAWLRCEPQAALQDHVERAQQPDLSGRAVPRPQDPRVPQDPTARQGISRGRKGYVYLQEFVPNEGHDMKVVVVAGKVSFLARRVRRRTTSGPPGVGISSTTEALVPEGVIRFGA
jgi:hypothetical protein